MTITPYSVLEKVILQEMRAVKVEEGMWIASHPDFPGLYGYGPKRKWAKEWLWDFVEACLQGWN